MSGKRPTAVGAYIFAGGFTLGVRKHFDVLAHLEDGPYGVETALRNRLVREVHTDPGTWPTSELAGKVDFLYANPPCAPWSRASEGRATHWTDDPRLDAVRRTYGLLVALGPRVWAWESVRPAWMHGRELVESIARGGAARGYSATVLLVDGLRHGIAQRRPRFFLVLHRRPIDWEPTGLRRERTVGEVLASAKLRGGTVAPLCDGFVRLLRRMRDDEIDLRQAFDRLNAAKIARAAAANVHVSGRPSFLTRRLRADRPSLIITGGAHLIHPTEDRYLSVEEEAALCGYPRSFKFHGSVGKQYAQVAQAVMPPVAEYLARTVAGSLGNRPIGKPYFERVEVFADRIEREALTLVGGTMNLKLRAAPAVAKKAAPMAKRTASSNGARPRRLGSGYRIRCMLKEGRLSIAQILTAVHKEFPDSKAVASDVYWNRRKLAQQGGVP